MYNFWAGDEEARLRFFCLTVTWVCAAAIALASPAGAVVFFADGAVHIIDGSNSIADDVVVANDPGGAPTTLNLLSGGVIGLSLDLFQDSIGSMQAGSEIANGINVHDNALFTMNGGTNLVVVVDGNAQAVLNAGQITQILSLHDEGFLDIAGAEFNTVGFSSLRESLQKSSPDGKPSSGG